MSNSTAAVSYDIYLEVSAVINIYIEKGSSTLYEQQAGFGDLENVFETAGLIQLIKANFTERISALPTPNQANLFDRVLAQAILRKATNIDDRTWSEGRQDEALAELTYRLLYSSRRPSPYGALSLDTLIDEVSARLTRVSTMIEDQARELDSSDLKDRTKRAYSFFQRWPAVLSHERVACLMALLYKKLDESPSWKYTSGHRGLQLFGFEMSRRMMRLTKDLHGVISKVWVGSFVRVIMLWLDVTGRVFIEELLKQPDRRELYDWKFCFNDFFRSMPDTSFPPPQYQVNRDVLHEIMDFSE